MDYFCRLLCLFMVLTVAGLACPAVSDEFDNKTPRLPPPEVFKTQAENPEIFLQRKAKGIIPCRMDKPYRTCSWKKDTLRISTTGSPLPGYAIQRRNNSECNLTISVVRANDSGTWFCNIPGNHEKQINAIVGAIPTNYFVYNNNIILSDARKRHKVIPNPKSQEVEVKCVSSYAYPAPSLFSVKINNRLSSSNADPVQPVPNPDGTFNATKSITLQFPAYEGKWRTRPPWENSVDCLIYQKGFEFGVDRISTVFAQEYVTENIYFDQMGSMSVRCWADGFPEPRIEIQNIDPVTGAPIGQEVDTSDWKYITYVCKATNTVNNKSRTMTSHKITIISKFSGGETNNVAGKIESMRLGVALYAALVVLLLTRG